MCRGGGAAAPGKTRLAKPFGWAKSPLADGTTLLGRKDLPGMQLSRCPRMQQQPFAVQYKTIAIVPRKLSNLFTHCCENST
jgi:hypothetical protein